MDADDFVADGRLDAEFFLQLAPQGIAGLFALFDLAAGNSPDPPDECDRNGSDSPLVWRKLRRNLTNARKYPRPASPADRALPASAGIRSTPWPDRRGPLAPAWRRAGREGRADARRRRPHRPIALRLGLVSPSRSTVAASTDQC